MRLERFVFVMEASSNTMTISAKLTAVDNQPEIQPIKW